MRASRSHSLVLAGSHTYSTWPATSRCTRPIRQRSVCRDALCQRRFTFNRVEGLALSELREPVGLSLLGD